MTGELESIPTSELITKAERTPIERAIVPLGCFLASALAVASWFAVFWLVTSEILWGLWLCWVASLLISFSIFSLSKFLAEFRNRHLLRELDRRFGRWSISAYIRYYQEKIGPGAMMCVFSGQGLPYGRRYWGCIHIGETGQAKLEAAASHSRDFAAHPRPWSETEPGGREVTVEEYEEICQLIEKTKGLGRTHVGTGVRDGFPAWLAIIFGDGSKPTIISTNLSGLTDEQQQDDRIKLLRLVWKMVYSERRIRRDLP